MNRKDHHSIEERLSVVFDQGYKDHSNDEEKNIIDDYQSIQSTIRSFQSYQFDHDALKEVLIAQNQDKNHYFLKYVLAACFIISLIGGTIFLTKNQFDSLQPIEKMSLVQSQISSELPEKLKQDLLWGKSVSIPENQTAIIELEEGTKIIAEKNASFSIQFNNERNVYLNKGKIEIHAAKNEEHSMIVHLPMGNVHVVGTIFQVDLTND